MVSMTTGAVVLLALGNNPPSAGPFCLSAYYRLDPINKAISSHAVQSPSRWNSIEVYFSGTKAGNIGQLAALGGLANSDDINCHFVICNGLGGADGQIMQTKKWENQWSVLPAKKVRGSDQTIRICVIADDKITFPTDSQVKRTEALVEELYRKFDIPSNAIYYPVTWR